MKIGKIFEDCKCWYTNFYNTVSIKLHYFFHTNAVAQIATDDDPVTAYRCAKHYI